MHGSFSYGGRSITLERGGNTFMDGELLDGIRPGGREEESLSKKLKTG